MSANFLNFWFIWENSIRKESNGISLIELSALAQIVIFQRFAQVLKDAIVLYVRFYRQTLDQTKNSKLK